MDRYKKRPFDFGKVAENRELRAKRKSVDRANIKDQRLSVLRQICAENLELEVQDKKPAPETASVIEEPKKPSRLEMLRKWKEEKEKKKKLEASRKLPVFKVSKVANKPTSNFQPSSKITGPRTKGNVSFSAKPAPLKPYNYSSTAGNQEHRPYSTKSVSLKAPTPRSVSTTQVDNSRTIATRSKKPDQHCSPGMHRITMSHEPQKISLRKGTVTGVNFRSGIKPPQQNNKSSIPDSKNGIKSNASKNAGISTKKAENELPKNVPFKPNEFLKNDTSQPKDVRINDPSKEKQSASRSSFAPDDFRFTAPSHLKALDLPTKGVASIFADIFKTSVPKISGKSPIKTEGINDVEMFSEIKPKVKLEEPVESFKNPNSSSLLDIPKQGAKRISAFRPLHTISETEELSGGSKTISQEDIANFELSPMGKVGQTRRSRRLISIYDRRLSEFDAKQDNVEGGKSVSVVESNECQTAIETPVNRLMNRLHNLKVNSPAQQKGESEVSRPFTRLQQRISLLGTPEKPQTRARRSIKGDLICFSPSV